MPTVPIGESGNAGGSPIPVKWLLLGGGGLLAAFLFMRGKGGSSGGDTATGDSTYGNALGPNAALALGGLQTSLMQESGYLQQLFTDQAQALGDQSATQYQNLSDQAASFDFWQTAQRRGEDMNIRASREDWTPLQWAQNARIYAGQMISMRPDLASYFETNWSTNFGDQYDWDSVVGQAAAVPAGSL